MADTKAAIEFVLRQEDSTLAGTITNYPGDRGGATRFGLTARWHPELVASGFFSGMDRDDALALAEQTYTTVYSGALGLDAIQSQAIATALLSFAVLEGTNEAARRLQKALVALGAKIGVDGDCGPATITAANATDPERLIGKLVAIQKAYFAQIARNIPSQARWVKGWTNRADAILALARAPEMPAAVPTSPIVASNPTEVPSTASNAQESPTGA